MPFVTILQLRAVVFSTAGLVAIAKLVVGAMPSATKGATGADSATLKAERQEEGAASSAALQGEGRKVSEQESHAYLRSKAAGDIAKVSIDPGTASGSAAVKLEIKEDSIKAEPHHEAAPPVGANAEGVPSDESEARAEPGSEDANAEAGTYNDIASATVAAKAEKPETKSDPFVHGPVQAMAKTEGHSEDEAKPRMDSCGLEEAGGGSEVDTKVVPKTSKAMSQKEITKTVATIAGLSNSKVKTVMSSYLNLVASQIVETGSFKIAGAFNLKVVEKAAKPSRKGFNPFTKQPCIFKGRAAYKDVEVKALKKFHDLLNAETLN